MEEKGGFVEQSLGRFDALHHHAASERVNPSVFVRRQFLPVKTTTGKSLSAGVSRRRSRTSKPDISGRPQIEHHTIELARYGERSGLPARSKRRKYDVIVGQQFPDAELLGRIIFDNQEVLLVRGRIAFERVERRIQPLFCGRLREEREGAARETVLAIFIEGQHLHGDVASSRVLLQMIQNGPPKHVGQKNIERDGSGVKFGGQGESVRATLGDDRLETFVASQIADDARVVGIIFDDQQNRIARLKIRAVVVDRLGVALFRDARQLDRWTETEREVFFCGSVTAGPTYR